MPLFILLSCLIHLVVYAQIDTVKVHLKLLKEHRMTNLDSANFHHKNALNLSLEIDDKLGFEEALQGQAHLY